MQVNCPQCGKAYNIGDEYAGRKVKCKACEATFTAEAPSAHEEVIVLESEPGLATQVSAPAAHHDDDYEELDLSEDRPASSRPSVDADWFTDDSEIAAPTASAHDERPYGPNNCSYGVSNAPHPSTWPTCGLATGALVCGIVGLLFAPLGLIAVILGIVALAKIGKPENMVKGGGKAVTGIVLGVIGLVILPFAVLLPALNLARRTSQKMTNSIQLRGMHQSMVNFAQTNKNPTGDGYYAGLTNRGRVEEIPRTWAPSPFAATGLSGDLPEVRLTMVLNRGYITPEFLLNPMDMGKPQIAPVMPAGSGMGDTLMNAGGTAADPTNFSYALLKISDQPGDAARTKEWSETINGRAVIMSDRNTAASASGAESIWTPVGSGDWEGNVVFNDNSAQYISRIDPSGKSSRKVAQIEVTRYADQAVQGEDHLFKDAAADVVPDSQNQLNGRDAAMVHKTASDLVNQTP